MKKLLIIFAMFMIFVLSACGGNENKDVYFKNGEVKLDDFKIKITETKVIPVGVTGNKFGDKPLFTIWYETTNLSGKEINPITAWNVVFTAIQDNDPNTINKLEMGALPDLSFLHTQLEIIKKDGTVSNAFAYKLDDLETPVTLVAKKGVKGDELGREVFEIK